MKTTGTEILVIALLSGIALTGLDCIGGAIANKWQEQYGEVSDKRKTIDRGEDGYETETYTLTINTAAGEVYATASRSLYNSTRVGDWMRIKKRVGLTGISYGYQAENKSAKISEQ